jgi:hypothetical protein
MRSDLSLYAVAAQVIPLFLGFLAFELRAFAANETMRGAGKRANLLTIATSVLLIGLLSLGEFVAIRVLARGVATAAARTAVVTAMFAGGLLLTLGIVEGSIGSLSDSYRGVARIASSALLVIAVALWFVLA